MSPPARRSRSRPLTQALAATAAMCTILTLDGWQIALLALTAYGGILTTRVRFAHEAALSVLAAAALLALAGGTAGPDERPARDAHHGPIAPADRPDRHR